VDKDCGVASFERFSDFVSEVLIQLIDTTDRARALSEVKEDLMLVVGRRIVATLDPW